jgi:tRNA (cmo5U34)-methyltransferase
MGKKEEQDKENSEEFVDKLITAVPGGWKFNKEVAKNFDSHVKKSVPIYNEVQEMVVEMSEWFIRDGSKVYDIGCSTGKTISLLSEKHKTKKKVEFIGIESSLSMLKQAKKNCDKKNVNFLHQDVGKMAEFTEADFVTSLYTLQFLTIQDRKKVLQRIFDSLAEGGALIITEKIRAENSAFEDMWLELYWDFKKKEGFTTEQIIQKAKSLRGVLVPLTLTENLDLLRDVGFTTIDTFAKWYNFAGIVALKSGAKASCVASQKKISKKNIKTEKEEGHE